MPTEVAEPMTPSMHIRTATASSQCRCAKPLLGYRAEFLKGDTVARRSKVLPTRPAAAGWAVAVASHVYTGMRIVPEPNLEYQPDCLGAILPGDRYIEHIIGNESAHYCLRCGIERAASGGARP
ncbi:hypothetical protein [Mycobacterium hubeiense]|uniref:hypothetical protein n=1 Tax=Mycobacterium hubeiense TaxID=1867256 RepID=UPI000C7EDC2E|nr:hypothetical protein [Mycobacterium sp. QGD 101]